MQGPSLWADWAQIISVPVAIIALLISVWLSVWLYRRGRQRRTLACEFDPIMFPIEIKAGEALEGDLEIYYKGQAITSLFLVRAKLKNTGNMAIRKEHIVEPVTFTFGPDTELLRKPRVLEKKPENLEINWDFAEDFPGLRARAMSLDFDLLNPGEELTAEFMCTGRSTLPKVTARIEGISEIEKLEPEERRLKREAMSAVPKGIFLLIFLTIAALVSTPMQLRGTESATFKQRLILVMVVSVPVFWFAVGERIYKWVQYRRHKARM